MSSQTPSEHSLVRCSSCQSSNISVASDYGESYNVCHGCGTLFSSEAASEIEAVVTKCPHCESVDAIVDYGGSELCNICGLDPNVEEYSSSEIAHLWKKRGPEHAEEDNLIREVMVHTGPLKFLPDSNIGKFLRSFCGPHCPYNESCPQTTKNFSRCYQEEKENQAEDMSKRHRKGKNKAAKAQRKAERAELTRLHSRAWLLVAGKGWYVKTRNYENENHYQKQSKA